jgi:repressor LexA
MNVKERLKQFAQYKKLRITALEEASGLSNGYINNIRNSISDQKLEQITQAFPDLDPVWLRMGVGEMIKTDPAEKGDLKEANPNFDDLPVKFRPIPLISIDAMAGDGRGDTQVMGYDSEQFVIPTFAGAEFLITVRGISMFPKYNSGDIVACKRLSLDTFFQWNKVYVLDTSQGALIKRIRKGSDSEHVLIVSDNEDYQPFELHRAEIRAIAIVIGVIRLE